MKTYQDLLEIGENEQARMDFVKSVISDHKGSDSYRTAARAELYMRQQNPTIMAYRKMLRRLSGEVVPDNYSANHKSPSNFFKRFVVQESQYLLGYGVTFGSEDTKDKLGGEKFDRAVLEAGEAALIGGVAFGFFNNGKVEVFKLTEFAPIWDEENGALRAGVRFWQIAGDKPLRATLFEPDGVTEYRWKDGAGSIIAEKRPYILNGGVSDVGGAEIRDGENYPDFPIVPIWGNPEHQSEIIGLAENIDAFDLIKSGFANDLDDVSQIYWIINNAGGMDDVDLARFRDRLKTIGVAVADEDGATFESHTVEIPYAARETYLNRLERDMYADYMALDVKGIAAGSATATAILAAYEPFDQKSGRFEACVTDFIKGLLMLAGVDDVPTYHRVRIVALTEQTNATLAAAQYLDNETILNHLPFIGVDEIPDILARIAGEQMSIDRLTDDEGDDA